MIILSGIIKPISDSTFPVDYTKETIEIYEKSMPAIEYERKNNEV